MIFKGEIKISIDNDEIKKLKETLKAEGYKFKTFKLRKFMEYIICRELNTSASLISRKTINVKLT